MPSTSKEEDHRPVPAAAQQVPEAGAGGGEDCAVHRLLAVLTHQGDVRQGAAQVQGGQQAGGRGESNLLHGQDYFYKQNYL